ncbi:GNAT family N-acetyltransferase [Rhizobium sp. CBK13]|nr:GNAT family N-acetyltransferase [Rhizobium sp. CBK13]MDE8762586.1 GNAT family N-acetyltransferase [Rhizobium sp. CBK13]
MLGSRAIGAARLDLTGDREACVRTVAIKQDFQRKGYGRTLMARLEALALAHSVEKLIVNAARDAVGFYKAVGWTIVDAARDNPVLMKRLRADA